MRRASWLLRAVMWTVVLCPLAAADDGFWKSQGFGYVFDIQGPTMKAYEVTATTCVVGFTAKLDPAVVPGREATFRTSDGGTHFIKAGEDRDHRLLNMGSLNDVRIDRISKLPDQCDQPTPNTPDGNFEVFVHTWAEHYIGFLPRKVDWASIVAEHRAKITPQTTPKELWDILVAMIKPFGDIHTGISAPRLKRETPGFFRPGTDRVIHGEINHFEKQGRRDLFSAADRTYLRGTLRNYCKGQLQYGHLNDSTSYLRILAFGDYARRDNMAALESALDKILADPALKALVLDLRLSFGGDDKLGLAIASRLATREYLAYRIQARADPANPNTWTPADSILVRPTTRPSFHGPVVELTGPIAMSAAETFTMALMGRNPHVTRIGENTQGVFCDVMDRHLPNGWTFGLPNAIYQTEDGDSFDVRGVPPDIQVPVFADTDVASHRDPAIEAALQLLRRSATAPSARSNSAAKSNAAPPVLPRLH